MTGARARSAFPRRRKARRRAAPALVGMLLALGGLLWAAFSFSVPGQAGQAQAQFRVGLRIDARLVALDLARGKVPLRADSDVSTAARADDAAASRQPAAPTVRRLRRADGSGWCVRVSVGQGRFRWQCD